MSATFNISQDRVSLPQINRTPITELDTATCVAGLLSHGDVVLTRGGWDVVRKVTVAPDHAAVVIVRTDSRPQGDRYHCDDRVTTLRAPGAAAASAELSALAASC